MKKKEKENGNAYLFQNGKKWKLENKNKTYS